MATMSRYYYETDDDLVDHPRHHSPSRPRRPDARHSAPYFTPTGPPYPPSTLQIPAQQANTHRPRSVPPPGVALVRNHSHTHRPRRDSREDDSDSEDGDRSTTTTRSKARHVLENTFSQSTSGLGVGVLGAIVGGLAAREASERGSHGHGHGGHHRKEGKGVLISTIVGAAVVGLGANAIEKRVERRRREKREEEGRGRKEGGGFHGSDAEGFERRRSRVRGHERD
ncbi:hypothetical protein B0H67DRAFT_675159 [Lasiosphaeris hirsuta]|uniref:Uncharacterized protein n=1 Tax=Lasiosphaeris hirsuta TaxID=260670 RepID=A0AA39ZXD7_9PEZI|nr:hypothetical protein B0H67DRAFT_675159 [Lasiosphaeris hirsuta]